MKLNNINNLHMNFINESSQNFKNFKVCLLFKDNIWGIGLADMQLISKYNKGFRFFLFVTDRFSKYAWDVAWKDKKGLSIVNVFQNILVNGKKAK